MRYFSSRSSTPQTSPGWLWGSLRRAFGVTYFFNRIGVRQVSVYVVIGAGIWLAFLKSGVHPTVAGVLLGFLTPSRAWVEHVVFRTC